MNTRTRKESPAYWGRQAVGCLFRKFNCPEATLQTCQDMLGRKDDALLTAAAGLVGGVAGRGSSCGLVSGGALGLALMHEAELAANNPVLEAEVVSMARDYVKWFTNSYGVTRCAESTRVDFWTAGGLLSYVIPGHKMVRCMSHIYGAGKCLHAVKPAVPAKTRIRSQGGEGNLHCAKAVLEGIRAGTGVGDLVLERVSIVLDGGIGFQGGACGALAGAVLAVNLLLGRNLREMSMLSAYYTFFRGMAHLWSQPSEHDRNSFSVGKRLTTSFEREAGSIECRAITGREFDDWQTFQSHLRSSKECSDLIHFAIKEATYEIREHQAATAN